jgi:thioester reductase-like protein
MLKIILVTFFVSILCSASVDFQYLHFLRQNAIGAIDKFLESPGKAPYSSIRSATRLRMLIRASWTSQRDWSDYPDLMNKLYLLSKVAPEVEDRVEQEKLYQLMEWYREKVEKAQSVKEQWGVFHSDGL